LYDTNSNGPPKPQFLAPRGDDFVTGRHGGTYKTNPARSGQGSPAWTKWANTGRGNYAFFDGHVASLTPNEVFNNPGYFYLKAPY
jgi:prepilin-type processing-associated H-X9-DG protein